MNIKTRYARDQGSKPADDESGLNVGLAAGLALCKDCGGKPTTKIGGGLVAPEYWWICSRCGAHPSAARTYVGAWNKWQKSNKAANVLIKGRALASPG